MSDTTTRAKLRPEVKDKWLAALRSGEYEQGQGFLHQRVEGKDRLCCLGVLCDLAVDAGLVDSACIDPKEEGHPEEEGQEYIVRYYENTVMPPKVVVQWAYEVGSLDGAREWMVTLADADDGEEHRYSLAELNDQRGLTFDQIADVIEDQL